VRWRHKEKPARLKAALTKSADNRSYRTSERVWDRLIFMADGGRQDVLGQKAQAAQRAFEARGMSPAKALRRALSRSADMLWDLALMGQSVVIETLDQDGVIDGIGENTLLLLLDGPDGALGIAEFDREVVTGFVEVQTIQQVTSIPVEDRPLTTTDAALMAPIIDDGLKRFVKYLDGNPLQAMLDGYRFGAMLDTARSASHLLDAASYRAFRADIDLALGRRKGRISFVFPDRQLELAQDAAALQDVPGPHEADMLRVPASLECMLARIKVPLSRAERLRPGDLLQLPPGALEDAELRAAKGHVAARGKLGHQGGVRALRVTWPKVGRGAAPALAAAGQDDMGAVMASAPMAVSYTHLRAHETVLDLVCRLLLEKKK